MQKAMKINKLITDLQENKSLKEVAEQHLDRPLKKEEWRFLIGPQILHGCGWNAPEWVQVEHIIAYRILALKEQKGFCSMLDILIYLHTASLQIPLRQEETSWYFLAGQHVFTNLMPEKADEWNEITKDRHVYDQYRYDRLRRDIYKAIIKQAKLAEKQIVVP